MNQSNLYHLFKTLIAEIGLPDIRFHDLRHTAASFMLNHGIAPMVVSKRLGHAKVSITLDTYGHLIPELHGGVAQMIDDFISPIKISLSVNRQPEKDPIKYPEN
jgi:integrase